MGRPEPPGEHRVKENTAKCVNSDDAQLKGLQGKFQLIGNGVFVIYFQNEHHRASQYWLFRSDGSATVKELPDRGERQTGISWATYNFVQLTQVVMIAFAGVAANLRLLRSLRALSGGHRVARKILFAWLAGNLFLGSQLCWILRPFMNGRRIHFQGNFYETVFRAIGNLLSP